MLEICKIWGVHYLPWYFGLLQCFRVHHVDDTSHEREECTNLLLDHEATLVASKSIIVYVTHACVSYHAILAGSHENDTCKVRIIRLACSCTLDSWHLHGNRLHTCRRFWARFSFHDRTTVPPAEAQRKMLKPMGNIFIIFFLWGIYPLADPGSSNSGPSPGLVAVGLH